MMLKQRYRRPPRGRLSGRHDRYMLERSGVGKLPGDQPLAEIAPRAVSEPPFSLGNQITREKGGAAEVEIGFQ